MDQTIISFTHVGKRFTTDVGKKPIQALSDLSFQVNKGEVLGIIGPNGAGKSTAIKILMGFVRHDHGEILLNGLPPTSPTNHRNLGYLPENPCLYKHLTIYDHLMFSAKVHNIPAPMAKSRIINILNHVNLQESMKMPVGRFSKGMTQRGALAYSLLHEPDLLILDEPMSGLDPIGRQLVLDIIQENKKQGKTILFCSHILSDVERICDRISIMHHGRIAASTTPDELNKMELTQSSSRQSPLEIFFFQNIQSPTSNA